MDTNIHIPLFKSILVNPESPESIIVSLGKVIMIFNRFNDKNRSITRSFKAGDFFCPCGICRDQIIDTDRLDELQLAHNHKVEIQQELEAVRYHCDRYKNRLPEIDTEKQIEDKLKQIEKDLYL